MPRSQPYSRDAFDKEDVPKTEQGAFNFTPSQAATTEYEGSMVSRERERDDDDTRTRVSSYTYASSDATRFLREVDNRRFNALNEAYFLPSDPDEWNRLDGQHIAILLMLGSPVAETQVVHALLAPQDGVTKKILDVGCGTGVWALEMAREFPESQVTGIDLAPIPMASENALPNCHFEIDDVNLGLPHFKEQFDLIHSRLICGGIKEYRKTMTDVHQCLKPGGMVIWIDVDYEVYSGPNFDVLPLASEENPNGSWFHRIFYEVRRLVVASGKTDFPGMSRAFDQGLWDDPLIDPETCKSGSMYGPLSPWTTGTDMHQTQLLKYVGSLFRQDMMNMHRATHPLLKKAGWSQETLDEWSRLADDELMNNKHQIVGRIRAMWGRRRAGPGLPAPPVQLPATSSVPSVGETLRYPWFIVHDTQESALKEAARHNSMTLVPPPRPPEVAY